MHRHEPHPHTTLAEGLISIAVGVISSFPRGAGVTCSKARSENTAEEGRLELMKKFGIIPFILVTHDYHMFFYTYFFCSHKRKRQRKVALPQAIRKSGIKVKISIRKFLM